jgi:hypothetical protein
MPPDTSPARIHWWVGVAVGLPALALLCVEVAFLAAALVVGPGVRWPAYELNLAEAVAVRDTAEVVRQLEAGADPNLRQPVRPGLLGSAAVEALPLEAAVSIRRPELVAVLRQRGAEAGPDTWRRLTCFAQREGFGEIVAALSPYRPGDAEPACAGDAALW